VEGIGENRSQGLWIIKNRRRRALLSGSPAMLFVLAEAGETAWVEIKTY